MHINYNRIIHIKYILVLVVIYLIIHVLNIDRNDGAPPESSLQLLNLFQVYL